VVGVVGSEHQVSLALPPQIEVFMPFAQQPNSYMTLVTRTAGDPALLEASVTRVIGELDPNLAVATMTTMESLWKRSFATQRFFMLLLITFSVVGLALAVVGVYGVMAQLAQRRIREMGIRIALGAPTGHVQWLVVRRGLELVSVGVVLGVLGALGATRAMRSMLFGVAPTDLGTFLIIPVVLAFAALAATWLPAARASRADPAAALRAE
jgi:putative ABC transport system permease protein